MAHQGEYVAAFIVQALDLAAKFGPTFAAIAEAAIAFTVNAGIAYGVNSALAPDGSSARGPEFATAGGANPHRILFGRTLVYGDVVAEQAFKNQDGQILRNTDWKPNQYQRVMVLAGHEIAEIEDVYIGDEKVQWSKRVNHPTFVSDNSPDTVVANSGRVHGRVYNKSYSLSGLNFQSYLYLSAGLGAIEQQVDAMLHAIDPVFWPSTRRLRGLPYIALHLLASAEAFPGGAPQLGCVVKGLKVYDPRDPAQDPDDVSTHVWSDNTVLLAAHFDRMRYGPRRDTVMARPSRLADPKHTDWEMVRDGADVCDEIVPQTGLGTEKRYRTWGQALSSDDPFRTLQRILLPAAGWYAHTGNVFRVWPGKYYAPVQGARLEPADFTGPVELVERRSSTERFGAVEGSFWSEDDGWRQVTYPRVTLDGAGSNPRVMELSQDMTPSAYQAQRVALIELKRRGHGARLVGQTNLKGLLFGAGDVPQLGFPDDDVTDSAFWITDWSLVEGEGGLISVRIEADQHTADMYADPDSLTEYNPSDTPPMPRGGYGLPDPVSEATINAVFEA